MGKDRELSYILSLQDEATKVWKNFSGAVTKETTDMKSMFGGLGSMIGGAFTIAAAGEFMKSAADAQQEVVRLEQALKQQGITQEGVKDSMLEYSETLKNKTGFDDDEITRLQATMFAMTGNLDAVRKLTPAVLDLARGTGISTEAAAKMFSKSVEGAEGLKKLGITIGETKNETERFNAVYTAINAKYGGQAAAWAETDAGRLQKLKLSMDDLGKGVGKVLNEIIAPAMEGLTPVFNWLTAAVPVVVNALKMAFAALYEVILAPLATVEAGLNMLGITQSKLFQGLDKSAANLRDKYANDVAKGFGVAGKAAGDSGEAYKAAAAAQNDAAKAAAESGKANLSTSEKLKALKSELDTLTVGTVAYTKKAAEVARVEKQVSDATELAKRQFGGMKEEIGYLQKDLDKLEPGTKKYIDTLAALTIKQNQYKKAVADSETAVSMMLHKMDSPEAMKAAGLKLSEVKDKFTAIGVEIKDVTSLFADAEQDMQERANNISSITGILGNNIGDLFKNAFSGSEGALKTFLRNTLNQVIDFVEGIIIAAEAKAIADSVLSFGFLIGEVAAVLPAFAALEGARAIVNNNFHVGGTMGYNGQRVPLAADERPAVLKVGETVRTVEQEKQLQKSAGTGSGGTVINLHFNNATIADKGAFKRIVQDGMREFGITDVADYFKNNSAGVVIA